MSPFNVPWFIHQWGGLFLHSQVGRPGSRPARCFSSFSCIKFHGRTGRNRCSFRLGRCLRKSSVHSQFLHADGSRGRAAGQNYRPTSIHFYRWNRPEWRRTGQKSLHLYICVRPVSRMWAQLLTPISSCFQSSYPQFITNFHMQFQSIALSVD
jgi:hypothetical protein